MIPNFKNGWTLMKTTKVNPTGFIGYSLTLYDKDDVTIIKEIKSKTVDGLFKKIVRMARGI